MFISIIFLKEASLALLDQNWGPNIARDNQEDKYVQNISNKIKKSDIEDKVEKLQNSSLDDDNNSYGNTPKT